MKRYSIRTDLLAHGWEEPLDSNSKSWYIKGGVGILCKETDGKWYFYPLGKVHASRLGPYSTLTRAAYAANHYKI